MQPPQCLVFEQSESESAREKVFLIPQGQAGLLNCFLCILLRSRADLSHASMLAAESRAAKETAAYLKQLCFIKK